jgi:quercetin dioxygenase-like cupin family protein
MPISRQVRHGNCKNGKDIPARFHWVRKLYEPAAGVAVPKAFVTSDKAIDPIAMPDTQGRWATTRFVEPDDLSHDMHVNIVTFQPGGVIPFEETHVMEHGLYVLEGKAVYKLNQDWVEVEAGDFMWLRAYCPQACYAAGTWAVQVSALQGCEPARETARDRGVWTVSGIDLKAAPLTAEDAFHPFGDVLEATRRLSPDQRRALPPPS